MHQVTLTAPAFIAGKYHPLGTEISVSDESIVGTGYKTAERQLIRNKITNEAGDTKSLLGTVSDTASYMLDDTIMDVLAVEASADSSYKAKRISLYEELHGDDSWETVVTNAQSWFDKRKSGEIKLPSDVKSIESVFEDVATRSTGIANILEQVAATA